MKKTLVFLLGFFLLNSAFAQGYKIKIKINGLQCPNELILANHYGDKQYARDTSTVCNNGEFQFVGKERLESGVYLVVLPNHKYFEMIISDDEDQTKYYLENDTNLNPNNMIIKGSPENVAFFKFNVFAAEKGVQASGIMKKIEAEEDEVKKKELFKAYNEIGKEVAAKRQEVVNNNPELFIAKLYKSMKDITPPEVPEGIAKEDVNSWKYIYVRSHYWDNVDLGEDGLVRSPVFHAKLKEYFDNFVPPIPDTAIMLADRLIKSMEQAGSKEQFKYTIHYLLKYFQDLKYLCFDKATHYIASTYYCSGKAFWIDSAFRAEMCEQSEKMASTLCGQNAPDLNMPDSSFMHRYSLYDVESPVTIVVFWDHECGHCKKEMPILKKFYDSCNKQEVFIYAVYTQGDWEGWKNYVKDKELKFLNVANAFGEDKFRKHYNITTTPQIYVLNKDKEIIFKKVGAADLPGIVQHLLETQGYKEPSDDGGIEHSIMLEEEYHD